MILMELHEDVANPSFDGRRKRGVQSLKTFEKGERFAMRGNEQGGIRIDFRRHGEVSTEDPDIISLVIAHSRPVEAQTFSEIAATLPGVAASAERVLDKLLEQRKITPEDIRSAF